MRSQAASLGTSAIGDGSRFREQCLKACFWWSLIVAELYLPEQ